MIAEYVRDVEGARDVLRDALLERGLEPLPPADDASARLEGVLARLSVRDQVRIASARVRALVPDLSGRALRLQTSEALDAVDADPAAPGPDALRIGLFRAWTSASGGDRRIVWAAWMVLRGSPTAALRTARAVRATELEAQIVLVADAFAA